MATSTTTLRKVLVIVGTTGAGKTKLSIDLAKAVGGEIVNSDAMQMYRGLDIATAKIKENEKEGIPHHMFDIIDPSSRCDVLEFKKRALNVIDDILARGKVPIIVGGTMYYTQAILWKAQLLDDVPIQPNAPKIDDHWTPTEIYEKLQQHDPIMAKRWHVNQTRRVRRSLEVFYQTGIPHSTLISQQEANQANTELLFDTCALWIHCRDKDVLTQRLVQRVDKMMESGLVDEIKRLRAHVQQHPPQYIPGKSDSTTHAYDDEDRNGSMDHTVGILQAIGYKEFSPYLNVLETAETDTKTNKVLEECIEQLNIATRQYARRQLSWIRSRFVPRNIPVYQIDSSDVSQWKSMVSAPAIAIAQAFLRGEPHTFKTLKELEPDNYNLMSTEEKYKETLCEICGNRKFVGITQWSMHLRSKGHRYHLRRIQIEKEGRQPGQPFDKPHGINSKSKVEDESGNVSLKRIKIQGRNDKNISTRK